MAKRPENRRYDITGLDQRSLLMGVAKAVENRRENKKDEKYQKSLKKMGMLDGTAGGRGPGRGKETAPRSFGYGGKANKKGYMNGGCVMGNRGVRKTQMV